MKTIELAKSILIRHDWFPPLVLGFTKDDIEQTEYKDEDSASGASRVIREYAAKPGIGAIALIYVGDVRGELSQKDMPTLAREIEAFVVNVYTKKTTDVYMVPYLKKGKGDYWFGDILGTSCETSSGRLANPFR